MTKGHHTSPFRDAVYQSTAGSNRKGRMCAAGEASGEKSTRLRIGVDARVRNLLGISAEYLTNQRLAIGFPP